jgi:YTH domain-containing family protein
LSYIYVFYWPQVKLEQGLQVLKIFKDHVCKTSILDDFGFYDNRENMMQERKAKQQQSLKKVCSILSCFSEIAF